MSARTVRDFSSAVDVWPIVEGWMGAADFRLVSQTGATRRYQRGYGFLTAPMVLEITQTGSQVHLESWISVGFIARLSALFLVPAEMGIESGGFRLVVPRNIARKAVNDLLPRLGQPPIG